MKKMPYKIIAALGDSITDGYCDETSAGWFGRMSSKISAAKPGSFGFSNLSQSGDRVCDAFHRLCSELLSRDAADVLLIAVGVNDLIRGGEADSPTNLSKYLRVEYWNRLLDVAQKNANDVVVLDILPIRQEFFPWRNDDGVNLWWHNKDIVEYNDLIAEICKERKIPFIRRYEKWAGRDLAALYADFVHPNGAGHQLIADEVFEELAKLKIL